MNFQLLSLQGFVICAAYFFAGFIDAVCGGGGLITVPALMAIGIPAYFITGTNQASTVPGSFAAVYTYGKSGKYHLRSAAITIPFALIGSFAGAKLNMLIPERYLMFFMLAMVPLLAVFMLVKKDVGAKSHIETLSPRRIAVVSACIGLTLGTYQGFYGPGGGTFFLLAYALFLKLDLLKANGNTRIVVSFSSIVSSITYALAGRIVWPIAFAAMLLYMLGSYTGARFAIRRGSTGIRPLMFFVIVVLMGKVIYDLFF